ncbi:hypothetical protein AXF42_Ash001229 [Apostasia shenzhenica]|uniref:Myb-like domain-containing protein n=1 Tax=Apostasia shenzhenica TaxID=1088818 RepID=A0A2I0AUF2_9ASPA|nr:hypothetical protein AXF42_Ash001229 [Apostasia shenzhenica]
MYFDSDEEEEPGSRSPEAVNYHNPARLSPSQEPVDSQDDMGNRGPSTEVDPEEEGHRRSPSPRKSVDPQETADRRSPSPDDIVELQGNQARRSSTRVEVHSLEKADRGIPSPEEAEDPGRQSPSRPVIDPPEVQDRWIPPPPPSAIPRQAPAIPRRQEYAQWTLKESRALLNIIERNPSEMNDPGGMDRIASHFPGKTGGDVSSHVAMVQLAAIFMGAMNIDLHEEAAAAIDRSAASSSSAAAAAPPPAPSEDSVSITDHAQGQLPAVPENSTRREHLGEGNNSSPEELSAPPAPAPSRLPPANRGRGRRRRGKGSKTMNSFELEHVEFEDRSSHLSLARASTLKKPHFSLFRSRTGGAMGRKRGSRSAGHSPMSPSKPRQPAPPNPSPLQPAPPGSAGLSTAHPPSPSSSHASPPAYPFSDSLPSPRTWSSEDITTFLRLLGEHAQDFTNTPEFWGRIKQDLPEKSISEMREMYFKILLPAKGGPQSMDVDPLETSERQQIPPSSSPSSLPPSTSKQKQSSSTADSNRDGPMIKATQETEDGSKKQPMFMNADQLLEFVKEMQIATLFKNAIKNSAASSIASSDEGKKPLEITTPSQDNTKVPADDATAVARPGRTKTHRKKSRVLEPATSLAARTSDAHDIDPAAYFASGDSGGGGGFSLPPELQELCSKSSGCVGLQFLKAPLPGISGHGRSSSCGWSMFPALRDEHNRSRFSDDHGVKSSSKAAKPPSPAKGRGPVRTGSHSTQLPLELRKYCWSIALGHDGNKEGSGNRSGSSTQPEEDRRKSSSVVETSTSGSAMPPAKSSGSGQRGRRGRSRR